MAVIIGETVSYPSATDSRDSTLIAETNSYPSATDGRDSTLIAESSSYETTSLTQVPTQYVQQKVWDTVAGGWVMWETDSIDFNGGAYPGPGVWGANTSDYRIQTIKFSRS